MSRQPEFNSAKADGAELPNFTAPSFPNLAPPLKQLEACERYKRAVEDWLWEPPASPAAVLALLEFAGTIAGDKLLSEATREAGPVISDETGAFHQVIALAAANAWLNKTVLAEWSERERLRRKKAAELVGGTEQP